MVEVHRDFRQRSRLLNVSPFKLSVSAFTHSRTVDPCSYFQCLPGERELVSYWRLNSRAALYQVQSSWERSRGAGGRNWFTMEPDQQR